MLSTIFLWLFIILISLYIIKEIRIFFHLQRYKKQGVKNVQYIPSVIKFYYFFKDAKSNDFWSTTRKRFLNLKEEEDIVVVNHLIQNKALIHLVSHRALKDFFRVEKDVAIKDNGRGDDGIFGFFMANGEAAKRGRGLFAKFFHYEYLVNLMPQMRTIIQTHLNSLKNRVENSGAKEIKIDIKNEIFIKMFEDMTGLILLGEIDGKVNPTINGMNLAQTIKAMFTNWIRSSLNPLIIVPFSRKLGLIKESKKALELSNQAQGLLKQIYNEKTSSKSHEKRQCILDIMIDYNKKVEEGTIKEGKLTFGEIAKNFQIFQFAASDTSFHTSSSCLMLLATNKEAQQILSDEISAQIPEKENYTDSQLTDMGYLARVVKETLRMIPPAPAITTRKLIKNVKICGKKLLKGDNVMVSPLGLGMNPHFFPEPRVFDPQRFTSENEKKRASMQQIPFSTGLRSCMGKNLGEMMVKIIVSEFLRIFEVEVEKDYEMQLGMNPLYGVSNSELLVSLRK